MVGVGNQTGYHSQDGQGIDLHVRVGCELEVGGKGGDGGGDTERGRERGREERGKRKEGEKGVGWGRRGGRGWKGYIRMTIGVVDRMTERQTEKKSERRRRHDIHAQTYTHIDT